MLFRSHAARAGNYILLALVESVDVYDLFLTRTTIEKAEGFGYGGTATTVRDFALFAYSDTTVYDPYLTRTIATKMNKSFRSGTASASIDDYALIAGGYYSGSSPYYDTVEAYRYV